MCKLCLLNFSFAWLTFANEQVVEKNYKALNGSQVGGCKVVVDYCGQKSSNSISPKEPTDSMRNITPK